MSTQIEITQKYYKLSFQNWLYPDPVIDELIKETKS